MRPVLLALLAAFTPAAAQEWSATPEHRAVHRALSARHFDGDCARIEALADEPVKVLADLVEHAEAPPWVPMRAAACLAKGHATEVQPSLERWVSEPELLGLGIQTLGLLDAMPEEVALAVARKAVTEGPAELDARGRIEKSERQAVRALAKEASP